MLIVEDEAIAALGLEAVVAGLGYEVCQSAASGEEAVKRANACRPDIILMDVNLGEEMDGIEAAREIRSRKNIPMIFISGYSNEVTRKRTGSLSVAEYMEKPVDFDELERKMQMLLYKPD